MDPVTILATGMVTGVGFNAPASCAAIRVGIAGFVETRFMFAGEWLLGCPIPFEQPWRGREKLIQTIVPAIQECLVTAEGRSREIPLLLCLAETGRPGRIDGLDETFLQEIQARLGKEFHSHSAVIANGRIGGVQAIDRARKLIAEGRPHCVVAGVDTLLVGPTLAAYNEKRRLQTADNSDGFIPGEAGAAILLGPRGTSPSEMRCLGIGYGIETATPDSEQPLRGDGMVEAFKAALKDSGKTFADLSYRITDLSGAQYGFKEAALTLNRMLRERKEVFDIWHPADCVGEVGAAIVPCVVGVALAAARKGYAPGPGVLCHFAGDSSDRAAMVLRCDKGQML